MTLSGLSRFNVENALAAASAALAAGIDRSTSSRGCASFRPDPEHNPGRMNFFTLGEVSVVMDLAHNEAGLEAMIEIMRGVRAPGRRLLLGLGAVGDRQDDLLEMLGEIAARDADVVAIGHKEKYLRGRTLEEMEGLLRAGAERVGVTDIEAVPHRARLAPGAAQARGARRRGRADVPRGAPGGLRLARRAGRHRRHARAAAREGATCRRAGLTDPRRRPGGLGSCEARTARGRITLATVTLGSGIAMLDGTVVNIALRRIGTDLEASLAQLQWVSNGYLLSLASLILVGGALGDRLGRRRIYLLGVAGFAARQRAVRLRPVTRAAGRVPRAPGSRGGAARPRGAGDHPVARSARRTAPARSAPGPDAPASRSPSARSSAASWSSTPAGAGSSRSTCRCARSCCCSACGSRSRATRTRHGHFDCSGRARRRRGARRADLPAHLVAQPPRSP